MKSVYIQIGFYKTYFLEISNRGREIKIQKIRNINCGNNFLIGRLNRVDEYVERVANKLKTDFKSSLGNAILILPLDFCIESLVDVNSMESKNKAKEAKSQIYKNRHTGLNSISSLRLGHNSYNDMYLNTEYDGKRLDTLLKGLTKKGIVLKQVMSPLYGLHHLARCVVCPFEVVNSGNNSNVVKTGILMINTTLNRIVYTLVHNNLPIEIREGSNTFVKFVETLGKYNISFIKAIRLLNLKGVEGLNEISNKVENNILENLSLSDDFLLDSLEDLDKVDDDKKEDKEIKSSYFITDMTQKKESKRLSFKMRDKEADILDIEEDKDIYLDDIQYEKFEELLLESLINIRNEMQKTLNYFINTYGVRISNIMVVSNDVKGLDSKLIEYSNLKGNPFELCQDGMLEVEDYTLINESNEFISSQYSLLLGSVLSNFVRGNIYE